MRDLRDTDLVGEGSTCACYRHPEREDLCIKIPKDSGKARTDLRRELRYHRHLRARGADLSHVAIVRESIPTNLGRGYVYDLVRDGDGVVSRELKYYLQEMPAHRDRLRELIAELGAYLCRERIVTTDFRDHNVLCRLVDGQPARLVVIDGVSDPALLSLRALFPSVERKRVQRRWANALRRLEEKYPGLLPLER